MTFEETLTSRRSIRRYKAEPVSREDIDACLQAAILAPSWKNSQTPRFYVVQSPEIRKQVDQEGLAPFNADNAENAAVLVVMTFVRDKSGWGNDGAPANEGGNGWGWFDLGLACENFCLQAANLGLGTLIMGIRDAHALKRILGIPENEIVGPVVSLGHPDIDPVMPTRHSLVDAAKLWLCRDRQRIRRSFPGGCGEVSVRRPCRQGPVI
ncbi:nitroreductase family protein [Faecalibaculum rodentium]|uniref:nitroreductase family protein n=2 Tax=Faecalibaculum rodentium TaxID=1702221 RepID=UPI00259BB738|nr:nitroreductase family protein [Faecalibaculum rodentium]